MSGSTPNRAENRILRLLPREEFQHLALSLESVRLDFKQVLHRPDVPTEHVYFPNSGVASVRLLLDAGFSAEVATIGNEGMTGFCVLLGAESASADVIVQVAGTALRLSCAKLKSACQTYPALSQVLHRYFNAFLIQLMQSVACNSRHALEQRFCRWLLMTCDRLQSEQLPLTHELLAQMLGVRRASVTETARKLQSEGLIRYIHGKITVLDREALEATSCECYRTVRREFDRLLANN